MSDDDRNEAPPESTGPAQSPRRASDPPAGTVDPREGTDAEPAVADAADPAPPPEAAAHGSADEASPDALFEALWTRVLGSWEDDKPHTAILEHALRTEMLPDLAGLYRAQKDVPGHAERAKKKLDALIVAATQMLMATKTEKPEKAPWQLTASVAVVCVLVLVWVAFKVLSH